MRVISGAARGRRLKEPIGLDVRPTGDKVKESVFDAIQFNIEGKRILDLFAGTGQMGIEALSRGARECVFVDAAPNAIKLVGENLALCGFTDSASLHIRDASKYIERCGVFDIIFIDPPYDTQLAGAILQKIIEFDKLDNDGIIICETRADTVLQPVEPPYYEQKTYMHGSVKITRFVKRVVDLEMEKRDSGSH